MPVLTNQRDNVLFEMRVEADKGDVMNEISLQFDEGTDLKNIESIRLFYSGTEAFTRKGEHFSPVGYIAHRKNAPSEADRDYSDCPETAAANARALETLMEQFARVGKALIVQDTPLQGSVGESVLRILSEAGEVHGRVRISSACDMPIPASGQLERQALLSAAQIRAAAIALMA